MERFEADAVRLTADSPGAIGVILVAGGGAGRVVGGLAGSGRAARMGVGAVGKFVLKTGEGNVIDEAVVVRTGEERWELQVHGGTAVMDGVLGALAAAGARVRAVGEAGELLGVGMEGELQVALPGAATETALRLLVAQPKLWGAWTREWRKWLAGRGAGESLWELQSEAQWVLRRSRALLRLLVPARVAIIGPPNAGKSTLANALLGRAVSITSAMAGTTRDWVDARAVFAAGEREGGVAVPVVLVDTAGVRETGDVLESAAIARTHGQAAEAEVVVLVLDATREVGAGEAALWEAYRGRALVVAANKVDAVPGAVPAAYGEMGAVAISALTGRGLEGLMGAVLGQLDLGRVGEECLAFTERQRGVLREMALCDEAGACAELLGRMGGNRK